MLAHEALARKLGVTCVAPEIAVARLAQVLAELGISRYSMADVHRYMTAMAARKGVAWSWLPARACDKTRIAHRIADTVYSEPIPLPVLMTMNALVERLGDEVRFKIAAFATPKADPFLAVHPAGSTDITDWFVIERWDEPSFRGVQA